jgi:hypothetical protein
MTTVWDLSEWMHKRELRLMIAVFVATRVLMAFLAAFPDAYTGTAVPVIMDVFLYYGWAQQILAGLRPYVDVTIEYPPGTLPFIVGPGLAKAALGIPYRLGFIGLMIVVDAVTLWGLTRLSRRRQTALAAWLWVIGLPLLGPLCWLRLDLIPALTTVWALERLIAGRSAVGAAWLGCGVLVKVYPAFLLPSAFIIAARGWRPAAAAAAAGAVFLVPVASALPALIDSVVFYHAARGIEIGSTWSNLLLIAGQFGYDVTIAYRYGAVEVTGAAVPALRLLSTALSIAVVTASCAIAHWRLPRYDTIGLAILWYAVIALLLLTGSVFSPQFLIWLLAVGAGAYAVTGVVKSSIILLMFSLAVTQVLYPFWYSRLSWMFTDAVILLTIRNGLLAAVAVLAAREVRSRMNSHIHTPSSDFPRAAAL